MDATRALPAFFLNGHNYFSIAYNYRTNYIFAKPIRNITGITIVEAFYEIFTNLNNKGYKPGFNVTDNQGNGELKE